MLYTIYHNLKNHIHICFWNKQSFEKKKYRKIIISKIRMKIYKYSTEIRVQEEIAMCQSHRRRIL